MLSPPQYLSQIVACAEWQKTHGHILHVYSFIDCVLSNVHQCAVSSCNCYYEPSIVNIFETSAYSILRSNIELLSLAIALLLNVSNLS